MMQRKIFYNRPDSVTILIAKSKMTAKLLHICSIFAAYCSTYLFSDLNTERKYNKSFEIFHHNVSFICLIFSASRFHITQTMFKDKFET